MSKNNLLFILLFIVGCSMPSDTVPYHEEVSIHPIYAVESISIDMVDKVTLQPLKRNNGYYTILTDTNTLQTFFKVRAKVNSTSYTQQKISWYSNDYWYIYFLNGYEKVPIINPASYVTNDGYAYNMGAVNVQLRNKIVTIYGYYVKYNTRYIDSIKIFVN